MAVGVRGQRGALIAGVLTFAFALVGRIAVADQAVDDRGTSPPPRYLHADLVGSDPKVPPSTSFETKKSGAGEVVVERARSSARATDRQPGAEGGEVAVDEDPFPDVVLVGDTSAYWCSGLVLDPLHVLTAAHCAHATRVGFGSTSREAVPVAVVGVRKHASLDIAVLVLGAKAAIRTHGRRTAVHTTPPLGRLRILGFGVKDQIRLTGFGTKRQLDIDVDGWGCSEQRARDLGCIGGAELLIRGGRGNDTCLGDSGGPVFELVDDAWRLVAITSRGMRPKKALCGEGGVYVRVDQLDAWLKEKQ